MIQERIPPVPKDRFEAMFKRLSKDVRKLKQRNDFVPDENGDFQIGDVIITQATSSADGSITVSLRNAVTGGPAVVIGRLL